MVKFVSACVERDKKKVEKMDFCSYPPAQMIEITLAAEIAVLGTPYGENAEKAAKSTDFEGKISFPRRSWFGSVVIIFM